MLLPCGAVYYDLNHPDLRSGFGILASYDRIGTPRLSSAEVHGFYSYYASFSKWFSFRLGIQGSFISRNLDYSRLVFEDQFDGIIPVNPKSVDNVINFDKINYGDLSSGILVYGENKYWVGFSANHLLEPEQGFYLQSKLPRRYSIHGGYNFYYHRNKFLAEEKGLRITPTFLYKSQAKFDQVDIGIYFIQNNILFGSWFRGIPFKKDFNIQNVDAVNFTLGYRHNHYQIGYSYDWTISTLRLQNTSGSHEISIVYLFEANWPPRKKPARKIRALPCPDFKRSIKYKPRDSGSSF